MQPIPIGSAALFPRALKFSILFLVLVASSAAGAVAPAPTLTRQQAIQNAMARNPDLVRLHELELAAREREEQAAAPARPQIAFESVAKDGPKSAPGVGYLGLANSSLVDNYGADLVISQQITDFGRTLHSVRSRRWSTAAARYDETAQQNFVALQVSRAYDEALKAQRIVAVAERDVEARLLVVKQAQARYEAGLISRLDVDLASSSLAESRLNLIQAQNRIQQTFADLNAAMGVDTPTQYQLEDSTGAPPPTESDSALEQDVRDAVRNRPEIQALRAQSNAFHEQARAAAATAMPLLRAIGSVGALQTRASDTPQNQPFAVGLLLSWPLYNGGLVRAQVAEAKHNANAVDAQQTQFENTLRQQVTQSVLLLNALLQSEPVVEEQLRRSQDAERLATIRYQVGLGNLLELQQAQLALLSAETNAARLRYDISSAQAAVQYATGRRLMPGTTPTPAPGTIPVVPPVAPPSARPAPPAIDLPPATPITTPRGQR